MSIQKSGNVAVFWDYENCPAPASSSGYAIANRISALARSFGSIKVFKAYLEISDQSKSSLRSELQCSGVSLVDCPHNGRKDVADKMILVDMLSYAIDNPAPATVFLITGDRDFAYALSTLKNRRYRIVLVKRPDTHISLTFQACICFDWFDEVVHQVDNSSSQAEQRPQRQGTDPICNASASNPSSHSASEDSISSGADTEGTVDIVHRIPDRLGVPSVLRDPTATCEPPRRDWMVFSSPRHPRGASFSTSRDSTLNSALVQEKPQNPPPLEAPNHPRTQPETPCITLPENSLPRDIPPVKGVPPAGPLYRYTTQASRSAYMGDSKADISNPTRTFPTFLEPTSGDVISSIRPLSSPIMWSAPAPPITPHSTAARRIPGQTGKSVKAPVVPPMSVNELAEKSLVNESANNISPIIPSSTNLATNALPPKTSAATAVNIVKPGIMNGGSVVQKPNRESVNGGSDFGMTSQTAPGIGQSAEPLDTPVIPPHFVTLVEALQWQRSKGIFLPYRSMIADRISKKGATYQKAGVSTFREYSLLAQRAGIVDMGGPGGGRDWISLKPQWYDAHVVAPAIPLSAR